MRFRELEIPSDVVAAHRDGKLVIFVGAGASVAAPSSLPNFTELVRQVARDSPEPNLEVRRADRALGDLEFRHGIDVHSRVASLLSTSASQPNVLHEALVRLALSAPTPRLVTTNFDHHLTTAASSEGIMLREYVGPAVPLGDDFEGLVYLHGKLGVADSKLVLTDRDFGAAYLRDGWATRFLDRMFSTFNVLFVGYSHEDITMEYLAKGLRGHQTRFILTPAPADPSWARQELVPIPYTLNDGSEPHSALPLGLSRWAERERAGLLDNDARVAEIVVAPPPLAPEDDDFLSELLRDPVQVAFILDRIEDPAWLPWLSNQACYSALFHGGGELNSESSSRRLAEWFAKRCTADEEQSREALLWLHTLGGKLSPTLWVALALALHRRSGVRPHWLEPWIWLLVDNDPGYVRDLLTYALGKSDWEQSADSGLLLLEHLTRPRIETSRAWGDTPTYDLTYRADAYALDHARAASIQPNMESLAPALLGISGGQVQRAHLLRRMYGSSSSTFDVDSFRRAGIAEHPQDSHHDTLDVVVDIARDAINNLAEPGEGLEAWVNAAAIADAPLLRRLATYAQGVRADLDPTQRLRWLVDRGFVSDPQLRAEVYALIKGNVGLASEPELDALVSQLRAEDPDYDQHEKFALLAWAKLHGGTSEILTQELGEYTSRHPDWDMPEEPESARRVEVGVVHPRPPMALSDFEELTRHDPIEALNFIRGFRGLDWSFTDSSWSDAAALLRDVATHDAELALTLAEATSANDRDLREALTWGWSGATGLRDEVVQGILAVLSSWLPLVPSAVASLLNGAVGDSSPQWWQFADARQLALECWDVLQSGPEPRPEDNWLTAAINDPAGHLAQFWMKALQDDRRSAGAAWAGIPEPTRSAMDLMVSDETTRGVLAKVLLTSQIRFLDAADHEWTSRQILPGLDWSLNSDSAIRNWHGFLVWGFWTERLLEAGLLRMYEDASHHLSELPGDLQSQLALHLATVILRSELIRDRVACALRWSADAPEASRVSVLEAIGRVLRDSPAKEPDSAWTQVIGPYWEARLADVPVPLTAEEAGALVDLIPTLDEAFADCVRLALRSPAALGEWSHAISDLRNEQVERHANEVADLLVHLLSHGNPPFWDVEALRSHFGSVKSHASPDRLVSLREAVVAFGITDARSW